MSDSKAERLAARLNEFIQSSPDVEAAAVVSFDGLAMASALPDGMDEDRVGAMSAALLSLGEQAAQGLGRGEMHQLFVEGEHGYVFLMSARGQAVLAAVTDHAAKIGFILYEMRRAAEAIGDILQSRWQLDEQDRRELAMATAAVPAAQVDPVTQVDPATQVEPAADPYYVIPNGLEPADALHHDWP